MRLSTELSPNSKLLPGRVVVLQTVNSEERQLQPTTSPLEHLSNTCLAQKAQTQNFIQIPNKHCPTVDNT